MDVSDEMLAKKMLCTLFWGANGILVNYPIKQGKYSYWRLSCTNFGKSFITRFARKTPRKISHGVCFHQGNASLHTPKAGQATLDMLGV